MEYGLETYYMPENEREKVNNEIGEAQRGQRQSFCGRSEGGQKRSCCTREFVGARSQLSILAQRPIDRSLGF
jgi:hypothetical protein